MTTADVIFSIEVQGAQAKRELAAISKSADTMGGSLDRVSASIKGVAGKIDQSFGSIERVMRQVGVQSSATGKMMLEVVGSAGDIAQAFAMGGPMLGGLAAGTAVVAALTKHWDDLIKKQDEAIAKQFAASDTLIGQNKAVEMRLRGERAKGGGSETAAQAFMRIQKEIDEATAALAESRRKQDNRDWVFLGRRIEMLKELQTLEASNIATKNAGNKKGVGGAANVSDAVTGGSDRDDSDSLDAQLARIEAANTARESALADGRDRELEIEREQAERLISLNEWAAKERQRINDEQAAMELATRTQLASQVLAIGVGSVQQLTTALITGQENALEHFAASVAQQAGSAMIGHGINAAAGGIAMLSLGNPAGAAALATGAGLIGGGIAIGGIGTGIEHTLAGGTIGKALPSKAGSDRGVNSGRGRGAGGGSGDGGGVTYTFHYGVAGPQPDETAREIARQNRRARDRGFADETITVMR